MIDRRIIRFALGTVLLAPVPALAQETPVPATAPAAAIDPARAALADEVVAALVPDGIYLRLMRDKFPKMMDAMMAQMGSMPAADFGETGGGNVSDAARKKDPAFDERMRIMSKVMGEEMGIVMAKLEPRVRAGLGRAFARKFTVAQLTDMAAFFATPSGKAFADDYLAMFVDPEMMREMAGAAPEMMRAMPEIMKKVEAATAHLPPPPKKTGEEK